MASTIRTLIVDDEPLAREGMRLLLGRVADVEIVGEAGDGQAAIDAIRRLHPDLALLDVQMPGLTGFDVVDEVAGEHLPLIVFVTAYDEYALKAFDVHAFDYLVKPVHPDRLIEALARVRLDLARGAPARERVMDIVDAVRGSSGNGTLPRYPLRFAVKDGERFVLVRAADVDWVDAAANYVRLHVRNREYLVRRTLTEMERQLEPSQFTRIHRSTIVNVSRIREVRPEPQGDFTVVLADGRTLRMSRTFRERLLRE
jgi:two-component system LytT family response regulator